MIGGGLLRLKLRVDFNNVLEILKKIPFVGVVAVSLHIPSLLVEVFVEHLQLPHFLGQWNRHVIFNRVKSTQYQVEIAYLGEGSILNN